MIEYLNDVNYLGKIKEIKSNTASIKALHFQNLDSLKIGDMVVISTDVQGVVAIVEKISFTQGFIDEFYTDEDESKINRIDTKTGVIDLVLVGHITDDLKFDRSVTVSPSVNDLCYALPKDLFKKIFATNNNSSVFSVGEFSYYGGNALVDGNKFFQRHCSILGSTGSGKSWTLAAILEKASKLQSSNLIVFDLHGEYSQLNYAKHLQIPGPDALYSDTENLLYLPFWLLDAGDLNSLFISKNDFSAHNQISIFQSLILKEKKNFLASNYIHSELKSFTIDSPIPFDLDAVIENLDEKNTEMITGSRGGVKQGTFYGQFSRMLTRIRNKINDKRYGFIFSAPTTEHLFNSLEAIAMKLMDTKDDKSKIKVIDFSSVPVDILPVIISVVAKLICTVQFWMTSYERSPISLVLDEAHVYLPSKEGQKNPNLAKCANTFEKIAKEGRKAGISLFVVSQRPSDISETILSQINNFIILKLSNYKDRSTIEKLLPDSFSNLLENLSILKVGESIIIGDSVAFPARTILDKPQQPPISATVDFWSNWCAPKKEIDFTKAISSMRKQSKSK